MTHLRRTGLKWSWLRLIFLAIILVVQAHANDMVLILGGNGRRLISRNDEGRLSFLEIFHKVNRHYHWLCHTYCLMNTHCLFIIKTAGGNLPRGMCELTGIYTMYYNRRHPGYEEIKEIPRGQRYLGGSGLKDLFPEYVFRNRKMRNERVAKGVGEWGYSQREVADHLSLHYSTLSRLMKEIERSTKKTPF